MPRLWESSGHSFYANDSNLTHLFEIFFSILVNWRPGFKSFWFLIFLAVSSCLLNHDRKGLIARRTEGLTTQFCHPRVLIKLPPVHSPVLDALANNMCVSSPCRTLAHTKLNRNLQLEGPWWVWGQGLGWSFNVWKRGRYGSKVNYIPGSLHTGTLWGGAAGWPHQG